MSNITLKMRDGSTREFRDSPRPGGSFQKRLRYEPGFVVITDEYYRETAIPTELIAEIDSVPGRY